LEIDTICCSLQMKQNQTLKFEEVEELVQCHMARGLEARLSDANTVPIMQSCFL
jgi:hypothetical protein